MAGPATPKSQGCIERANGDLQKKLGKKMKQLSCNWASALNLTIYEMNTTVSTVTGQTPYEMVFGQDAHTRCHELDLLAQRGILNEEEITGALIQEDPCIINPPEETLAERGILNEEEITEGLF